MLHYIMFLTELPKYLRKDFEIIKKLIFLFLDDRRSEGKVTKGRILCKAEAEPLSKIILIVFLHCIYFDKH